MTRERSTRYFYAALSGRSDLTSYGTSYVPSDHQANIFAISKMFDDIHPGWRYRDLLPNLDLGGPLDNFKVKWDAPRAQVRLESGPPFLMYEYEGDIFPRFLGYIGKQFTEADVLSSTDCDSVAKRVGLGATAISRVKPASPEASFGVFLTELYRDGIPSFLSRLASSRGALERFRGLGKDYLNLEFGWKPFVRDLREVGSSLARYEKIIRDLEAGSGKRLKREYSFPVEEEKTETELGTLALPWPYLGLHLWQQDGAREVVQTTKRTWFSGEFVYRFPSAAASSMADRLQAYSRHLLGADLSPETLYQATPWTWLADWFTNGGDVLANISAISQDDLVIRYAYLMQESVRRVSVTHYGLRAAGVGYGVPNQFSASVEFRRQTRIGASPFGFGLTTDELTPRQMAILAALGVTRTGKP